MRVCSAFGAEHATSAQRMILQMMSTVHLRTVTVGEDRSLCHGVLREGIRPSVSAASVRRESFCQPTGRCTAQWTAMEWFPWWAEPPCLLHQLADCFLRCVSYVFMCDLKTRDESRIITVILHHISIFNELQMRCNMPLTHTPMEKINYKLPIFSSLSPGHDYRV